MKLPQVGKLGGMVFLALSPSMSNTNDIPAKYNS